MSTLLDKAREHNCPYHYPNMCSEKDCINYHSKGKQIYYCHQHIECLKLK